MDQSPPPSPQGFASEDEEATYCLSLLRDGDRHQQIVARERLGQIFERRGLLDEAAQCLESNVREGVRDPRVYQRLAGIYRRQGRHELADEVLVEARRLAERLARSPQPGVRRPGRPGPGRPAPGAPASHPGLAPTAPLPAASSPPSAAARAGGGELELDQGGARGEAARAGGGGDGAAARVDRPWWLSPPMLVLVILLCGPYGLALMWVRGGYARQAKVRATAVWAGLVVLVLAAVAVTVQSQVGAIVAGAGGLPGIPSLGGAPTPIVFGTPSPSGGVPTTALTPGQSVVPPTPAVAPGALATRPAGVSIAPAPAGSADGDAGAEPTPSPTAIASAPTAKPAGERVRVADTGGTGVNLREQPGPTGAVVKTVPDGTVLQVIGSDEQVDGVAWRNVRDDTGTQGWIAAELLEPE